MEIALALIAGLATGLSLVAVAMWRRAATMSEAADAPEPDPAAQADATAAQILASLRQEMATLQQEALQQNNDQFLALAESRLQAETARGDEQLRARGDAIEQGLRRVNETLTSVTEYVQQVDAQRGQSLTGLATVMEENRRTMRELAEESRKGMRELGAETTRLRSALAGGQTRGQWGERMAEDVLRVAGMREGLNYRKNRQVAEGTGRPDYTFLLPQDRLLHMDVKFPLAGYLRYLEAPGESERLSATRQFLSDVRQRVREVTTRDYIDPASGTLDYVLVFIPNEQVYGFIHEQDAAIAEEALQRRVVLCSPLTLFAVLAVIRQSVESMRLEQHANEILGALGAFQREWEKYQQSVEKVGRRLASTQNAYDELHGARTRQLQRKLDKVELLREQAGVDADASAERGEQGALAIPDHYRLPDEVEPSAEDAKVARTVD